jgi:hypothetical protein
MNIQADKRLDTVSRCIGHGVQIESTKTPKPSYQQTEDSKHYAATGLRLAVFAGPTGDDGCAVPAGVADVYLDREGTDKLIALLQEHRARMEPNPMAVQS